MAMKMEKKHGKDKVHIDECQSVSSIGNNEEKVVEDGNRKNLPVQAQESDVPSKLPKQERKPHSDRNELPDLHNPDLENLDLIDRGGFGEVYKVWDRERTNYYAVKMVTSESRPKKILKERDILQELDHDNIVKFFDSWSKESSKLDDVPSPNLRVLDVEEADTQKNRKNSLGLLDDIEDNAPSLKNSSSESGSWGSQSSNKSASENLDQSESGGSENTDRSEIGSNENSDQSESSGSENSDQSESSGGENSDQSESSGGENSDQSESSGGENSDQSESSGGENSDQSESSGGENSDQSESSGGENSDQSESSGGENSDQSESSGGENSDQSESSGGENSDQSESSGGENSDQSESSGGENSDQILYVNSWLTGPSTILSVLAVEEADGQKNRKNSLGLLDNVEENAPPPKDSSSDSWGSQPSNNSDRKNSVRSESSGSENQNKSGGSENSHQDQSSLDENCQKTSKTLFIQMEFCPRTLHQAIVEGEDTSKYIPGLIRGLAYVHSKNIIHRDLNPANLLIGEDGQIKIADFGLATKLPEDDSTELKLTANVGNDFYKAPEVIVFKGLRVEYTTQADMYSVGLILLEMCCGPMKPLKRHMIFDKLSPDPATFLNGTEEEPAGIPVRKAFSEYKPTIIKLLNKDPRERPTADALLRPEQPSASNNDTSEFVFNG